MLRNLSLMLSLVFLSSCATGPKVTIEVSNPGKGGMDYYNEATSQSGFLPYSATDKHVCMTPSDAQTLLNYCGAPQSNTNQ